MTKNIFSLLVLSIACGSASILAQAEYKITPTEGTPKFDEAVQQEVVKIIKKQNSIGIGSIYLGENQRIALEIADKHPYAAFFFAGLYAASTQGLPIVSKSPRGSSGVYEPELLTAEKVKALINKYHNGEVMEKLKPNKELKTRFIMDYELVKTADGAAYLTFESALADKHNREIEKISPNIRVQLKRIEDEKGEKWEPVGWQTY